MGTTIGVLIPKVLVTGVRHTTTCPSFIINPVFNPVLCVDPDSNPRSFTGHERRAYWDTDPQGRQQVGPFTPPLRWFGEGQGCGCGCEDGLP